MPTESLTRKGKSAMITKDYPPEVIEAAQVRYYREYAYELFNAKPVNIQDMLDQEYKLWQQSHNSNEN